MKLVIKYLLLIATLVPINSFSQHSLDLIGNYDGDVGTTRIAMRIERSDAEGRFIMRQMISEKPKLFASRETSEQAQQMSAEFLNQIFSKASAPEILLNEKNVSCFHPLPPSPPFPFICRLPMNIPFKFNGVYGQLYEFKSATGAIYVFPFVDHLRAVDLGFSN